jgi:hypothetical protein
VEVWVARKQLGQGVHKPLHCVSVVVRCVSVVGTIGSNASMSVRIMLIVELVWI